MTDTITEFANTARRLAALCSRGDGAPIAEAVKTPGRKLAMLGGVRLTAADSTYGQSPPEGSRELLQRIREEMTATLRQEGEAERDGQLRAILAEIEALRAVICADAAKACVEAGQVAREIRERLA